MGKHYLHIELVNIVQLTCNTHIVYGGRSIVHDANMQYPPLYDIWMRYYRLGVLEDMCYVVLVT
jgi:hypothetical protein